MDRAGFGVEAFFRQPHTVFKEIWVSPKIKALPSWVSICCGFVAQLVSTVDKILTDNGSIASCTGLTFIMRGILSLTSLEFRLSIVFTLVKNVRLFIKKLGIRTPLLTVYCNCVICWL